MAVASEDVHVRRRGRPRRGRRRATAGGTPIPSEEEWTPEHLVLAGLARCTLTSLRHHARRRGHRGARRARTAQGEVTRRETDGRYAFVERRGRRSTSRSSRAGRDVARAGREGRARLLRRRLADREAALPLDRQRRGASREHDPARRRGRARALLGARAPLAFFDGPGGTQCPDEVIDAIADYLRERNANIGAPYETSVRTMALVERARAAAGAVPRLPSATRSRSARA